MAISSDEMNNCKPEGKGPQLVVEKLLRSRSLSMGDFERISGIIYELCGINLHIGKREMVQARLNKRLRQLGMDTYDEYLSYVQNDPTERELVTMVDILTTNLTYFFREPDHFEFLSEEFFPRVDQKPGAKLRVWCAGCSSGEEAYTLAMVLRESIPEIDRMDALILATDISTRVLDLARKGIYGEQRFKDTPPELRGKYFFRTGPKGDRLYQAKPDLGKLIRFGRLNLKSLWPMKGPFDVIMCRNVMIYFDKATQAKLVSRFHDMLAPGGVFIVGHSESLTGIKHDFKYIRPSVYEKR